MSSARDRNVIVAQKDYQGNLQIGTKLSEKKKTTTKGKMKGRNKLANEANKGTNCSTPSNSDDTDKQQKGQIRPALEGHRSAHAKIKGQTKSQTTKKREKTKKLQAIHVEPDATPAHSPEDESELCNTMKDSLRWEGVLEDPVAEQERIEVYKANRRKRYLAAQRACLLEAGVNFLT